ncbi:MAG: hypothetical protein F4X68_05595 [Acidimicrobiia bacterium]|nr:hypothetical protein [Acidimicrobiia bacterium]MYB73419.1 hypothetical protein [Acidimicrobiia bacterium]MYE73860.1 hypothetical protein [Acidimicrobiia bacterium]
MFPAKGPAAGPERPAAPPRPQPSAIIVLTDGYTPWPPGNHATVIAVLTQPDTAKLVPGWITTITATCRRTCWRGDTAPLSATGVPSQRS